MKPFHPKIEEGTYTFVFNELEEGGFDVSVSFRCEDGLTFSTSIGQIKKYNKRWAAHLPDGRGQIGPLADSKAKAAKLLIDAWNAGAS